MHVLLNTDSDRKLYEIQIFFLICQIQSAFYVDTFFLVHGDWTNIVPIPLTFSHPSMLLQIISNYRIIHY